MGLALFDGLRPVATWPYKFIDAIDVRPEIPPPFHCLSTAFSPPFHRLQCLSTATAFPLPFHCLSTAFQCLFLFLHRLSIAFLLPFHCLSLFLHRLTYESCEWQGKRRRESERRDEERREDGLQQQIPWQTHRSFPQSMNHAQILPFHCLSTAFPRFFTASCRLEPTTHGGTSRALAGGGAERPGGRHRAADRHPAR